MSKKVIIIQRIGGYNNYVRSSWWSDDNNKITNKYFIEYSNGTAINSRQ